MSSAARHCTMFCMPVDFVTCCISRSCVVLHSVSSDMSASHRHGSVAIVASAASKPSASTHASRPLYIFDSWAAGSGILRAVLQHMVHEGSIPGMHGKDTVPQFVRMLSRRGSSCTARCSMYGCTARTCVQNHPRTHGPQCHRNSTGPSLGAPRIHAQQACTSEHWETNTSSNSVVSQFVRMLCYTGWRRVVHVVPRVAAMPARVFQNKVPPTLRLCTAAREHSSWHVTMLYCGGGLRVETNAPTCRVRRTPGRTPLARLLYASRVFLGTGVHDACG